MNINEEYSKIFHTFDMNIPSRYRGRHRVNIVRSIKNYNIYSVLFTFLSDFFYHRKVPYFRQRFYIKIDSLERFVTIDENNCEKK